MLLCRTCFSAWCHNAHLITSCSSPHPWPWGISAFLCLNQGQDVKTCTVLKNTKASNPCTVSTCTPSSCGTWLFSCQKKKKKKKLSFVSTVVDIFSQEPNHRLPTPLSRSLRRGSSFSGSHTEAKHFSGSAVWRHILLLSLLPACLPALPAHAPHS